MEKRPLPSYDADSIHARPDLYVDPSSAFRSAYRRGEAEAEPPFFTISDRLNRTVTRLSGFGRGAAPRTDTSWRMRARASDRSSSTLPLDENDTVASSVNDDLPAALAKDTG